MHIALHNLPIRKLPLRTFPLRTFMGLLALAWPVLGSAHPGHDVLQSSSFLAGLVHPILGIDHLLAMTGIGILSAQIGGRALLAVPATFVMVMAAGAFLGWLGTAVVPAEVGIALSVLALGVAIATGRRLPMVAMTTAAGIFAVFHGYAHGTLLSSVGDPLGYGLGFLAATAGLHVLGILIGRFAWSHSRASAVLRVAGGATAGIGGFLLAGLV